MGESRPRTQSSVKLRELGVCGGSAATGLGTRADMYHRARVLRPEPLVSKRYYIEEENAAKGPYTEAQLRLWLDDGMLWDGSLVREEDAEKAQPLRDVLTAASRPAFARDVAPTGNVYAPPDELDEIVDADQTSLDAGNFWGGFVLGLFSGCIILFITRDAKPDFRNGVWMGFVTSTIVVSIVRATGC